MTLNSNVTKYPYEGPIPIGSAINCVDVDRHRWVAELTAQYRDQVGTPYYDLKFVDYRTISIEAGIVQHYVNNGQPVEMP